MTGTQTFVARAERARKMASFALELAPSVILSLYHRDYGWTGRSAGGAATDDAHPETVAWHSRICSLALIANLQNTDAAAGMTKELAQEGEITERDKVIFAAWQTSGSAIITNYFSSGVAVFAFWERQSSFRWWSFCYSIYRRKPLRIWINIEERRHPAQGAQS